MQLIKPEFLINSYVSTKSVGELRKVFLDLLLNKGNNKITEHRAIFQKEKQTSKVNKQTKSANNRNIGKTAMALTWYRHFQMG